MIVRKRHYLLLEVLIAFFIVAMCVLPLIYPHTYILISQRKFISKVELDHLVNLLYGDILERMYKNEIRWQDIINKVEFEVDNTLLERVKFTKKLPYKGTFVFNEEKHKPDEGEAEVPYAHYLLKLDFSFTSEQDKQEKPLKYHYKIFAVRNLAGAPLMEPTE